MSPHAQRPRNSGSPSIVVTPDELQRHADSVRALAQRLLSDEHAAEDVVQDTWVMALEKPPQRLDSSESFGGWLRSVARSLVRRQVRGHERRERRERESARPEAVGTGELQSAEERAATLRSLTDSVLSLSEPYRGTLLQRYFENLPPREIAKREGVSVATVKSRLQRGLERLRTGLDEEKGPEWRRELAAFVGLPFVPPGGGPPEGSTPELVESAPAAPNPGAIPMAGMKLIAGALMAIVGTTAVWQLALSDDDPRDERASIGELDLPSGTNPFVSEEDDTDPDSARVAVGDADAQDATNAGLLANPNDITLEVTVVDPFGLPVPGASIFAVPIGHAMNRVGATDPRGKLTFTWTSKEATTELALAVRSPNGTAQTLQSLSLGRGTQNAIELVDESPRAFYSLGGNISYGRVSFGMWHAPGGHALDHAPPAPLDEEGRTTFIELPVLEGVDLREFVAVDDLARGDVALATGSLSAARMRVENTFTYEEAEVAVGQPVRVDTLALDVAYVDTVVERPVDEFVVEGVEIEPKEPRAIVEGWVRDAEGVGRAGIPVAVLGLDGALVRRGMTGEEGSFRFEELEDGDYLLHAGGGPFGLARAEITAKSGAPYSWSAHLEPQARVEGQLEAEDVEGDAPAWEDYSVIATVDGPHGPRSTWARVDEQGHFSLPALGSQARVEVTTRDRAPNLTVASAPQLFANGENTPISIPGDELELAKLQLRVRDAEGTPIETAWIRIWQEGSTRGTWARSALVDETEETVFTRSHLPAGSYTLEIGAAGHATQTLTRQWIGAGEAVDLGTVVLQSTQQAK